MAFQRSGEKPRLTVEVRCPDGVAQVIPKAETQGLEYPNTPVIGGTAPNAHQKAAAALPNGVPNHFTYAIGGGEQGIVLGWRHQGKPQCPGHLNRRHACGWENTVGAAHRGTQRAGHGHLFRHSTHTRDQRLHSSFAAVSQRTNVRLCAGGGLQDPCPDGLARLHGGETACERVHGYHDVHNETSPHRICLPHDTTGWDHLQGKHPRSEMLRGCRDGR